MELENTEWELVSVLGIDASTGAFGTPLPSLRFDPDGKLSGFSGCNNFHGTYSLSGQNLTLDPGAMTRKACPGDGEKRVLNALNNTATARRVDDLLELRSYQGIMATYRIKSE